MVDALVLEASTSVCGFESHLPHQKKKGTERCLFLLLPRHLAMPNAARCGGDFRIALCVAGTCGSPTHALSLFCDTIQFAIETDRSCHRQGPGAGLCSRLFLCPKSAPPVPADLSLLLVCTTGFPKTALPEPVPQSGTPKLFPIPSSLAPLRPSRPASRERQRAALSRGGGSVPRQQCGTAKHPSPPHGPACRAQAHSEPVPQLFTLHSSLFTRPALPLFPSGTDSKTKIYFVFWSLDT